MVISVDTARADAFGCYIGENHWGRSLPESTRPSPHTPNVDALAAEGLRFRWALAHAPTTLSSHASIFSGRDPHRHSVVRNGYPVPAQVPLLAERFAAAGWATAAVIGASALERKMGLDRGFSRYDDPGEGPAGGMLMRGADDVTRRALAAIDATDEERSLLLFVHYYDPHMPWFTAPADVVRDIAGDGYSGPVDGTMVGVGHLTAARLSGALTAADARQARALYLSQVAWVDRQIGALLEGLDERGRRAEGLVVVLSDHGEVLDESPSAPYTHGPSVGLTAIHVPLIFSGRGRLSGPSGVRDAPARLLDVGPTILAWAGLEGGLGDGADLRVAPPSPIFSEATKPMSREATDRWNNLPFERSVVLDGAQLTAAPLEGGRARLSAVAAGGPEIAQSARVGEMVALLQAWDGAAPAFRPAEYDAETEAALRALGYLD